MEQAANQFAKGLQLDTHPMVQGNDTMSDCLNGTFVTMNGDEVILQNDMGNRKVDNAFLPAGYEPVGIKEYGGIIYLALYNPITNKSQLGSFPSPERIINGKNEDSLLIDFVPPVKNTEKGIKFLKSNYILSPLSQDNLLRAGDKFTLYWSEITNDNVINIINNLSNYNNITDNKVTSPKNKKYTLRVGILNSQNEFVDITDNLIRWNITNNTIIDTSDKTDLYKQNVGYFVQNSYTPDGNFNNATKDKQLIEQRQALSINTYSYKLVGPLYVKQVFNTIQQFNYNIYAIQTWEEITSERYAQITNQGYKKEEDGVYYEKCVEFTITADITYNCPDGITSGGRSDDDYKSYAESGTGQYGSCNLTGFNLYDANHDNGYRLISQQSTQYSDVKYNPSTNLYSVTVSKTYLLRDDDRFPVSAGVIHPFNYFIGVTSGFEDSGQPLLLENLSEEGSISLSDIESGGLNLQYWRYYVYDENTFDLTYRFQAYPKFGQTFSNLRIRFIPVVIENTSSDANARVQSEITNDDDDIQEYNQHQVNVIDSGVNQWSTIIEDENGTEYTLADDGEGNTVAVDNNGTEYDPDELGDYVIVSHHFDGDIGIIDNYEIEVNSELNDNYKLYGEGDGYQIYVGSENNNSNENLEENSNLDSESSSNSSSESGSDSGSGSESGESDYPAILLGDGTVNNGRVTYHFINNESQLPDTKRIMYKVELIITDSHATIDINENPIPGDKIFKCFLLNTELFNSNYSTASTSYVEDFRKFNEERYRKYLDVKLDIQNTEDVEIIDQYITKEGNPFKNNNAVNRDIEYNITQTKRVKIKPSCVVNIKDESLYPNYVKRPASISEPNINRIDNSNDLYNNIEWVNWSQESRPTKEQMINITLNGWVVEINNSDRFQCIGESTTLNLTNVFVPIRDALIGELEKVETYKTLLLNWNNDNADSGGKDESLGIYTFPTLISTDARNPVKLSDGNSQHKILVSKYLDIITQEFNELNSSFTFAFYYHNDAGRVIRFRNDSDSGINGPSSENYARLWWRAFDSSKWVTFDNAIYNDANCTGLLRSTYTIGSPDTTEVVYTDIFANSTFFTNAAYDETFYICYYQNKTENFIIPNNNKKYNEFYNFNLSIKTTLQFASINITNAPEQDIENYFIPRFYNNETTVSDIVLIPLKSDDNFHSGIDDNFVSEYSSNVILDNNGNLYNEDSKQRALQSHKIYSLKNGIVQALIKNPFKITPVESHDTYMVLCNSYSTKSIVTNYSRDICSGGTLHHKPTASYKNTFFFEPIRLEYES